ncbi:nicotinamide/nicotinic acid mononucleotide adenylyltransferase 3-like isoform X2 [Amphibalanus amphitrite]|uniref:nicotinamide/nicotinic acid mononucleotide adenylyltransferase 3-like isoform X2 n=1 Tax=Amphibalanus amphitrite TaxID=1232801 RepID=UPI001C908847|nr:nicotinamide/nicotinic acid mononucleotide adenylyltransferase 3-like isoform X2 [Amphibalanus amphitrite]
MIDAAVFLKQREQDNMTTPKKIILLACGSFNPPTHMHLRIFEIARDYLHRMGKYQVVAGLMSPVHDSYGKKCTVAGRVRPLGLRPQDLASASDRCEMVRRSLQTSNWIHLSDWECRQTGWTPTRQVLHHHQELIDSIVNGNLDNSTKRQRTDGLSWASELGSEQLHVKLLCGGDLLESFDRPGLWKDEDIEAIVGAYGLVVITREGSNPLRFIYESDVLTRLQRNIELVTEWIANEVSSSRIRRALGRCESVKYLMPDPVINYVHQRGLYGASRRPLAAGVRNGTADICTDAADDPAAGKRARPDLEASRRKEARL